MPPWAWRIATGVFGGVIAVGGLALDKRAEDRRQIEVIVEFYEHCYGAPEQRVAAARALQFFAIGGAEPSMLDPIMRGMDGLVGTASADSQQLIDDLLRDERGCGSVVTVASLEEPEVSAVIEAPAAAPAPPPAVVEEIRQEAQTKSVEQVDDVVASQQSLDRRAVRASRAYAELAPENSAKIRSLFFPRLFVHVTPSTDQDTLEALKAFQTRTGFRVNGEEVTTPSEQFVDVDTVQGVQLRFLKAADEEEAKLLAAQIERVIGGSVRVVDLSGTYQDDPLVRPRTFELWLGAS